MKLSAKERNSLLEALGKGAAPKGSLLTVDKSVLDMTRSSLLFTFDIPARRKNANITLIRTNSLGRIWDVVNLSSLERYRKGGQSVDTFSRQGKISISFEKNLVRVMRRPTHCCWSHVGVCRTPAQKSYPQSAARNCRHQTGSTPTCPPTGDVLCNVRHNEFTSVRLFGFWYGLLFTISLAPLRNDLKWQTRAVQPGV